MNVHLILLLILILLNLIPEHSIDRRKYILPFSFLLVLCYWGFRFDYGLDFWSYQYVHERVENPDYFDSEILFYKLIKAFPYFYQFIFFQSFTVLACLFYLVRKYIPPKYYWVFFYLLFMESGMTFNMISALRSTFAACIIWVGYDLFYISKKNYIFLFPLIFIASLFHTSALSFLIFPILERWTGRLKANTMLVIYIIADIISVFFTIDIFSNIVGSIDPMMKYQGHASGIENATLFGALHKALWIVPAYCISKYRDYDSNNDNTIYSFTTIFFILFFLGLTFQQRFTTYLFPFAIIALCKSMPNMPRNSRIICFVFIFAVTIFNMYLIYTGLFNHLKDKYSDGNYLFYHTIFEQPFL